MDLLARLKQLLLEDPEPILREQAAWAIARIAPSSASDSLHSALAREQDETVRAGILKALKAAMKE